MRKLKENLFPLSLLITIPLINIFYKVLNNPGKGAHNLVTEVDKATPFIKVFVLPYILWYFFIILTLCYFCFKDRKLYYRTLVAFDIGLVVSFFIFYIYQTTVPRPELVGSDIFTKIIGVIYSMDGPYNCFPSIHVLTSYLMMIAINKSSFKTKLNSFVIYTLGSLIIASTLFIKQHVVLDVIYAIFLGDIIFKLMHNTNAERVWVWGRNAYIQFAAKKFVLKKKVEI